jgi:ferredoxin--NADP+ reductase
MPKILEKRTLTPVTKLYRLDAPMIAAAAEPGQFVIVRIREGGERIPLTIADYDRDKGEITIVVQEVGATTRMLGTLEAGDNRRRPRHRGRRWFWCRCTAQRDARNNPARR